MYIHIYILYLFYVFFFKAVWTQTWLSWSTPWEELQWFVSVKSQTGSPINKMAWALNYCSFCHCKEKSIMSSIQSKRQSCSTLHRADTLHRAQVTSHPQKPSSYSSQFFSIHSPADSETVHSKGIVIMTIT